jgi:uncharacterized protein (DUF2141 family)
MQTLKPIKQEDSGVIIIEVQTKEPSFIVQLLDRNFAVLQSKTNTKKMSFEDLEPQEYQIRLIIDRNQDGAWSPGNFYKKEEPEHLTFYKNEKNDPVIKLRANFEIGPLLITY